MGSGVPSPRSRFSILEKGSRTHGGSSRRDRALKMRVKINTGRFGGGRGLRELLLKELNLGGVLKFERFHGEFKFVNFLKQRGTFVLKDK
jgi:hypothetical protein